MNSARARDYDETFPPRLTGSGLWICARYTQLDVSGIDVRVWESVDYADDKMKSLHFLGLVLKALHLAQGGDPAFSQGLVSMTSPLSLPLPNGTIHSTIVRPTAPGWSEERLALAWKYLACDLSAAIGTLGVVAHNQVEGHPQLQVDFGPVVAHPLREPSHQPTTVALSMSLHPGAVLRPGG